MSERREYCIEPECERPTCGHGERCEAHTRQFTRHGKCTPVTERLSPRGRFNEALIRAADAEEDAEYESACRTAWDIAKSEGMKSLSEKDVEHLARELRSKRVKAALAKARQAGKHIGRPHKRVDAEIVKSVFEVTRSISGTARALRLHRRIVRRALGGPKGRLMAQPPVSPAA